MFGSSDLRIFGKLQAGYHVLFIMEWLLSGPLALIMDCCRDGFTRGRFSSLHRGILKL